LARLIVVVGQSFFPAIDWAEVLAALDPVVALLNVIEPSAEDLRRFPPALAFVGVGLAIGTFLNAVGVWRLRAWNPGREPIMQRETKDTEAEEKEGRAEAHAAPGRARTVWANPVLWREIRTRAYGRRPVLIKLLYAIVLALICY